MRRYNAHVVQVTVALKKVKKKKKGREKREYSGRRAFDSRVIGVPQHRSAINGLLVISAPFLNPLYIRGAVKHLYDPAIKDRNAYITRTGCIVYIARDAHKTHGRPTARRDRRDVVFTIKRHNYIRQNYLNFPRMYVGARGTLKPAGE